MRTHVIMVFAWSDITVCCLYCDEGMDKAVVETGSSETAKFFETVSTLASRLRPAKFKTKTETGKKDVIIGFFCFFLKKKIGGLKICLYVGFMII